MPRAPKTEQADVPVMVGRRSTRISVAVPITISGKDSSGNEFRENTFTLNVNKHGAEIATSRALTSNGEVTIENSTLGRKARARVVLRRERRTPNSPYEVSLELLDPGNIWGVRFPPADWEQNAPPKNTNLTAPAEIAPSDAPAVIPAITPETGEGVPRPESLPAGQNGHEPFATSPEEPLEATEETRRVAETEYAAGGIAQPETVAPKLLAAPSESEATSADDQVHAASAAMARLSELVIRLEAASTQVEAMLAKAGEARARLQTETERANSEAGRVSKIAGEGALEEFRSRLSSDWESQSSQLLAEMKRRVDEEVSAAITAFGKEAGAHLARLTQESGPELEAKQKQAVSATKEQIACVADAATSEFHGRLDKLAEDVSAALNTRLQATLEKADVDAANRLGQSLREQSASLLEGESSPIPRLRQQMQESSAGVAFQFKDVCAKEIERSSSALKEELMKAVAALTNAASDANSALWESSKAIKHDLAFKGEKIRTQLVEISSTSEEGFKNYLHVRVKGAQEEMQRNLRAEADKGSKEFSDRLQKQADGLLESFGPQLQRQAEDAATLCKGSLESVARESLVEARNQVASLSSEALGTVSAEMRAQVEQFRGQLRAVVQEVLASGAQEMQIRLRQVSEEESRAALARIQSEGSAASERAIVDIKGRAVEAKSEIERAVAEIQNVKSQLAVESERVVAETKARAEAAAQLAADTVYKQLGVATVVLKDLGDQAAARLESKFREASATFEKQVQELSNRSLEASRIQSETTMNETRRRLEQATRILRGETEEPKGPA